MSQRALTIEAAPDVRLRPRLDGLTARMVAAEFLKVRKRRGLVISSTLLTIGVVVVVFGVMALLHSQNAGRYGPAGGISNLSGGLGALATLGSVAGILIGATMGAGDIQAGLFRDLVATGRSRVSLFVARVPGGLALLWPVVITSIVVISAASVFFAGDRPRPTLSVMVAGGAWVLLATSCNYLLALGVASLTGSRTSAVGQVFAWQFIVSPLLLQVAALGAARQALEMTALSRLMPAQLQESGTAPVISSMPIWLAFLVVAAWAIVPLAPGAWRTKTQDA